MDFTGFDWDTGNRAKCEKHGVSADVIEDLFTRPLAVIPDAAHSRTEQRFRAIGKWKIGVCRFHHPRRQTNPAHQRPLYARKGNQGL